MKPNIMDVIHELFIRYEDPQSGVVSYILRNSPNRIQEAFYFVNSGFSPSQRYLWFYVAYPPASGRMLGVIDFHKGSVNIYPETRFFAESPLITEEGAYWASDSCLCFRSPSPEAETVILAKYPDEFFGDRCLEHMSTHLTLSPDWNELFFEAKAGNDFFAGTFHLITKEYTIWKHFDRCYKHSQFCPTNPDVVLIAQDNQIDPMTGIKTRYDNRLWLLKRDGTFYPVFSENVRVTHEWWDLDGEHFYALNQLDQLGGPGILRFSKTDLSWKKCVDGVFWHAHDFSHGKWFVADRHPWTEFYRNCPSQTLFIDTASQKQVIILSKNPEIKTPGAMYHIDPHPRFSPKGDIISHTTTLFGQVDLALTFTEDVLSKL